MIPITLLVTGKATVSKLIKGEYGKGKPSTFSSEFRPIIVWNITWRCNLKCKHCYIAADNPKHSYDELKTEEAYDVIEQVEEIESPLLIFSGGEPLVRRDFWEIAEYASSKRFKVVLSTNGTLITRHVARKLKDLGFVYVGVSLDSPVREWNDWFRGVNGAFHSAINGIRNLQQVGVETGIRFTVTKYNISHVPQLIDLAVKIGVKRLCFYHLIPSGRGVEILDWCLSKEEHVKLLDYLIERSKRLADVIEIETVTSPSDGIYVASKIAHDRNEFLSLLEVLKGQGNCGRRIVSVYPNGNVHPCQFIDDIVLGNVRSCRLKDILREDNPKLQPFINVERSLRGERCGKCPFKSYCGGFRPRAFAFTGDILGDDPACVVNPWEIARRFNIIT